MLLIIFFPCWLSVVRSQLSVVSCERFPMPLTTDNGPLTDATYYNLRNTFARHENIGDTILFGRGYHPHIALRASAEEAIPRCGDPLYHERIVRPAPGAFAPHRSCHHDP